MTLSDDCDYIAQVVHKKNPYCLSEISSSGKTATHPSHDKQEKLHPEWWSILSPACVGLIIQ
jgi:hypothetical protein